VFDRADYFIQVLLVVDLDGLRANLEKWSTTGITGVVLLGSTGERVHLDEQEYVELIEAARRTVSSNHAFIVGAGQQSTRATISEINRAAAAGADAVLVITPSFYRSAITQETLVKHYTELADVSPVPVILYSMPALTGIKIEPATIARLSDHQNIIGVKDSSNDVEGFKQTVDLCPREFAVMTGNGTILLDALRAGATGACARAQRLRSPAATVRGARKRFQKRGSRHLPGCKPTLHRT